MWERVGEREREAPLAISQDSTTDTEVPPTPKNAPPSGGVFLGIDAADFPCPEWNLGCLRFSWPGGFPPGF